MGFEEVRAEVRAWVDRYDGDVENAAQAWQDSLRYNTAEPADHRGLSLAADISADLKVELAEMPVERLTTLFAGILNAD